MKEARVLSLIELEESLVISYISGDMNTWCSAKRDEEHDRVKHVQ